MVEAKSIKEEFLDECNFTLSFLKTDYGFTGPEIEELSPLVIHVTYYKKEIAIECSLDVRDEMISLRIVRLEDGYKPDVWRMNKRKEIVKEYLYALLKHRGVKDLKFEKPPILSSLSKRENEFRYSLSADVYWLKKYGQDILNGSAKIFEGYSEPGDEF